MDKTLTNDAITWIIAIIPQNSKCFSKIKKVSDTQKAWRIIMIYWGFTDTQLSY